MLLARATLFGAAPTTIHAQRTHSENPSTWCRPMDYTLESADRLAEKLRAIPAKDPSQRRLDKQGMVRHLASEILALQQRGYSLEEVAESLRGHGLDITTPTLKNYLQRTKAAAGKPKKARRPSGLPSTEAKAGQPTHASTVPPVPVSSVAESGREPPATAPKAEPPTNPSPEPVLRTGKAAFLIKDKESY